MPIMSKRKLKCIRCGKEFIIDVGDAISISDLKIFNQPYCYKCKIINFIKKIL